MQLTTLNQFLQQTEKSFKKAKIYFGHGTDNAWDEAVMLAMAVLDLPRDADASLGQRLLTESEINALNLMVQNRIDKRIPLPYLTHEAWFANLKFTVNQNALIPRSPLGELILNKFQPWLGNRKTHRILDLCTGGGCIAIACAHYLEEVIVDAVDISDDALSVAQSNIQFHHYQDKVKLYKSDLFVACPFNEYDIIISNPPYVTYNEWANLPPEYHKEPRLALEAGNDGLNIISRILEDAPKYLKDGGLLFVEVGNSRQNLENKFSKFPFTWLEFERGGEGVFLLSKEELTC